MTKNLNWAVRWYQKAAEKGNAVAQTRIGSLYERGLGVERNVKVANHWYRTAAETGYAEAQYNLGMMYMIGELIEPDYYEGTYWLEQAAEGGHAKAQDALGRAYYQGVGVRKDSKKAVYWFKQAAEQELPIAQYNLGSIYEQDFYKLNPREAAKWYALAAKNNDAAIAKKAKQRMQSGLVDSANIGVEKFGTEDRFPTQGEVFAAIVVLGIAAAIATSGNSDSDSDSEGVMYSDTVGKYVGDMRDPIQQWGAMMITDIK